LAADRFKDPRPQQVRVIGGRLRSRRIAVPNVPGVRPSPDRVRETLFNWLQAVVPGARCLDLFAGSGALGFEAWSRDARAVVAVDANAQVAAHLQAQARLLGIPEGAQGLQVVCAQAMTYLNQPATPFDIVFLDPPFHQGWVSQVCAQLVAGAWLAPHAYVYIEAEATLTELSLPMGWTVWRSRKAGQVGYHLVRTDTIEETTQ